MNEPIRLSPRPSHLRRFIARNVPHRTTSRNTWCLPAGLAFFIGGTYDTGNGYAWTPALWWRIERYYTEQWWKAGHTIWSWVLQTDHKHTAVAPHGLWAIDP